MELLCREKEEKVKIGNGKERSKMPPFKVERRIGKEQNEKEKRTGWPENVSATLAGKRLAGRKRELRKSKAKIIC